MVQFNWRHACHAQDDKSPMSRQQMYYTLCNTLTHVKMHKPLMSNKLRSEKFIFDGKFLGKIIKIIKLHNRSHKIVPVMVWTNHSVLIVCSNLVCLNELMQTTFGILKRPVAVQFGSEICFLCLSDVHSFTKVSTKQFYKCLNNPSANNS